MKQNNCTIIGITGGIGTGKSTVSNILISKGYIVIDADKIAREVVDIGKPAYIKIIENFSNDILLEDKTINRKKLAKLIFNDEYLREKLNIIIHPYIFKSIKNYINKFCNYGNIIFIDIPLLFEQKENLEEYFIKFKEIWLIYTDERTQLDRLMKRNSISKDEASKIIKTQIPIDEKKKNGKP